MDTNLIGIDDSQLGAPQPSPPPAPVVTGPPAPATYTGLTPGAPTSPALLSPRPLTAAEVHPAIRPRGMGLSPAVRKVMPWTP